MFLLGIWSGGGGSMTMGGNMVGRGRGYDYGREYGREGEGQID